MTIARFISRAIIELGRGFGLIVGDIHRALYGKFKARLWWIYMGIALLIALWLTGQLWNLIASVLTLIIIISVLYWMITAPFKKVKKAASK